MVRILIVEDDVVTGLSVEEELQDLGAVVVTRHDAEGAMVELAQGEFDAAIIDIALPGMRGDSLAKECRRRHPQMAIILTTGLHEHEVRRWFQADARIAVLEKPHEFHALRDQLERMGVTFPVTSL